MKYVVYVNYSANTWHAVEAASEQEAIDKVMETAGRPYLCHQCAREIEIGDFTGDVFVEQIED